MLGSYFQVFSELLMLDALPTEHSWPLPDHHGSPGIMKDHDGLFQGLTTFHHGTWIRGDP